MAKLIIILGVFASQIASAHETAFQWDETTGPKSVAGCDVASGSGSASSKILEITGLPEGTPQTDFPLVGSFWQATGEVLRCAGQADLTVFEVQRPGRSGVIATVAASKDSAIFKFVNKHTEAQAEAAFNEARAQVPQAAALTAGLASNEGAMEYVACIDGAELNVRDESLNKILFTAGRFEKLKPVQSFGTDKVQKTIDGKVYTFVKVQVESRPMDANTGWIADQYLKLRSQCAGAQVADDTPVLAPNDAWNFPTHARPTANYKSGQRKFKAGRSGGRLHAACDLYRKKNDVAQAVSGGKVIRDRYYFYQGTYALEVKHTDGKVVRYGEITGTAASGTSSGATVQSGQTIGYIGKVNSNCCEPMLHFEMYSGNKSGALTTSGNSFQRRSDLIDPSAYLTEWEKAKFGTNY